LGQKIFVDQYESSTKGCLSPSKGQESPLQMYFCGTFFYNAASQQIQVIHQVSLGIMDTINAKNQFEQDAMQCGVTVKAYHTDNGIFTCQQFCDMLVDANQGHQISGVSTHHQNGLTKHAVKTIQDMTQSMMLHLLVHCPDKYDVHLWPFAMDYTVWLYNHTPQHDGRLAPMEIFCRNKLNYEYLCKAKVFGCPTYILDPKLSDGMEIPKCQPQAHVVQCLGF